MVVDLTTDAEVNLVRGKGGEGTVGEEGGMEGGMVSSMELARVLCAIQGWLLN